MFRKNKEASWGIHIEANDLKQKNRPEYRNETPQITEAV